MFIDKFYRKLLMKTIAILGNQLLPNNQMSDTLCERLTTATELCGHDDIIITCGKGVYRIGVTLPESHVMCRWLVDQDITCQEIIQESRSDTTFDNFVELAKILQLQKIKECTIVTSDWHLLRCRYLAIHLLRDITVHWVGSPSHDYDSRISEEFDILSEHGFIR
jgi:uncharacterized SAM-binding protein YcdF (DUF218 family)